MQVNGVTTVIVRDGIEVLVGCYLVQLATYRDMGWSTTKRALAALLVAVPLAIGLHALVSELDERYEPLELAFDLIIPVIILYYCLVHLRDHRPKRGAYFAPMLVFAETTEVTISTLSQSSRQIRDGVVSGVLILALVALLAVGLSMLLERNLGSLLQRHMARIMALLNLAVGVFGLYVLTRAEEPLEENGAETWFIPLLMAYTAVLGYIIYRTVINLRQPHVAPSPQPLHHP
jgi:hypothetical protein